MIVSWSPCSSMPKPLHRLAGRGDAVDDLLRPAVLDADHDDRGDVRVAAGADQRAEVQVEVGAELQPAVRMRDRQRALDVVRDRLGGGVRQVVDRQDDDVVAHADAAVLAPVAQEGGVLLSTPCSTRSPALGLDVVHVRVLALADRRTTLPMSMPYLITVSPRPCPSARPCGRSGCPGGTASVDRPVLVHDQAGQRRAGLHAFDHDDGDRVVGIVQYAMDHGSSCGVARRRPAHGDNRIVVIRRSSSQLYHSYHLHNFWAAPRLAAQRSTVPRCPR